jgi:threonine dehydrogenase-like Zn-dependent dehydrogenase
MKANVFHGKNNFGIEEVEKPHAAAGEAVIRVTLTTICIPVSWKFLMKPSRPVSEIIG